MSISWSIKTCRLIFSVFLYVYSSCLAGMLLVPICLFMVCFLFRSVCFSYASSSCLYAAGLTLFLCMDLMLHLPLYAAGLLLVRLCIFWYASLMSVCFWSASVSCILLVCFFMYASGMLLPLYAAGMFLVPLYVFGLLVCFLFLSICFWYDHLPCGTHIVPVCVCCWYASCHVRMLLVYICILSVCWTSLPKHHYNKHRTEAPLLKYHH